MNQQHSFVKEHDEEVLFMVTPAEDQLLHEHVDTNHMIDLPSHLSHPLTNISSEPDLVIENFAKQTKDCQYCQGNFTSIDKIQFFEYLLSYWSRTILKHSFYIPLDIFQLITEYILCNKLQTIQPRNISFEFEIGRGTFSKVFKALWHNNQLLQPVSVKWFRQNYIDKAAFDRFVNKLSIAAHLPPHDNVLKTYGVCISPYALITEYMNAGSVKTYVSAENSKSMRSSLTMEDCVQMLIDAARGISHLHSGNIIHGDIEARSLLIEEMEDMNQREYRMRRVVVSDWGFNSRTQIYEDDSDSVTNSHVGPLKWMSPEFIKKRIYNTKTDVYSFGILMWEVLCGMDPYPSTKVLSLAVEVITKQTRPYVLSWFPRPVKILMQRCWQERPELRPTFEDIVSELERIKYELIKTNKNHFPLITISKQELTAMNTTKEKLRTLYDII